MYVFSYCSCCCCCYCGDWFSLFTLFFLPFFLLRKNCFEKKTDHVAWQMLSITLFNEKNWLPTKKAMIFQPNQKSRCCCSYTYRFWYTSNFVVITFESSWKVDEKNENVFTPFFYLFIDSKSKSHCSLVWNAIEVITCLQTYKQRCMFYRVTFQYHINDSNFWIKEMNREREREKQNLNSTYVWNDGQCWSECVISYVTFE